MEWLFWSIAFILTAVSSYLIGSINFAIIVTRIFAKKDIRDFGSGNAGMTNVLRTLGKGPAVLVTLGDFLKGTIALLIGRLIFMPIFAVQYTFLSFMMGKQDPFYVSYLVAIMVLFGHCFPIFYGFKGGKGILVSAGVIFALNPLMLLVLLAIFLLITLTSKIVSLGSIIVAIAYPILTLAHGIWTKSGNIMWDTIAAAVIGGLIVFMHRANIKRLINGTENKFGQKKK